MCDQPGKNPLKYSAVAGNSHNMRVSFIVLLEEDKNAMSNSWGKSIHKDAKGYLELYPPSLCDSCTWGKVEEWLFEQITIHY